MRLPIALMISGLVIAGCGGNDNENDNNNSNNNNGNNSGTVDYSKLQPTPLSDDALVQTSGEALDQHLKNGIRMSLSGGYSGSSSSGGFPTDDVVFNDAVGAPAPVAAEGAAADSSDTSRSNGNFSATNVHELGVDEADYAKYDGEHWFIATYPQYVPYRSTNNSGIAIYSTDPSAPNASYITEFELDEAWGDVSELYLVQDDNGNTTDVAAIRNQWGNIYPMFGRGFIEPAIAIEPGFAADVAFWPGPMNSSIRVQLVGVTNPAEPEQTWEIKLDGSLVNSRKIGNKLYLITRYDPWLETLQFDYGDLTVRDDNEERLAAIDAAEILPTYSINNGASQPLVDGCLLQNDLEPTHGLGSIVNITTIDLAAKEVVDSTCANINVEGIYMSQDALYIGGSDYEVFFGFQGRTILHKFALTDAGVEYQASGSVPGYLGWEDPSFRMNEHDGNLRVVTTSRDDNWQPIHQLNILETDAASNGLDVIATLPNDNNPAAIGKPNEDIYSVRFAGDRGYIVTFERIDPLYVLNLADPTNPSIAGELEVPGFSTYLHPIDENYLFSVGNDADPEGRVNGVKLELYDISDMANPSVAGTQIVGDSGTYSEALHNLRAISFLQASEDQLRVALPISVYQTDQNSRWGSWTHTGLYLYEINGLTGSDASIDAAGYITGETADENHLYPTGGGIDRGILHDETVFYTHANQVWAAHWDNPDNAVGPITSPTFCTLELRQGLQVTVHGQEGQGETLCGSSVTAIDESGGRHWLDPTTATDSTCVFVGATERAGTYDITVEAKGYETSSVEGVVVTEDECHVETQEIAIHLEGDGTPTIPPEEPIACTAQFVFGLNVVVTGDPSVAAICDATVIATEGDFSEELQVANYLVDNSDSPSCNFYGLGERPGTYDISVTLDGHAPYEMQDLVIGADECHVIPENIEAPLEAN